MRRGLGDRRVEERGRDADPPRRRVDVEADDRPDVLVVDARELRRVLEAIEGLARAEPAPADRNAVDVREQGVQLAPAQLVLEPRRGSRRSPPGVLLPAEVPVLAPAAAGDGRAAPRAAALEEIDDVVPPPRRHALDVDTAHPPQVTLAA